MIKPTCKEESRTKNHEYTLIIYYNLHRIVISPERVLVILSFPSPNAAQRR